MSVTLEQQLAVPVVPVGHLAVEVDGFAATSQPGSAWIIEWEGIGGWFDGAPVRAQTIDRPGQHGQFALPAFRQGRIITLDVLARTSSIAEVAAARAEVTSVLAGGTYADLGVREPDGTLTYASVRIDSATLVQTYGWQTVRAQLQLWSPDPYRYGELQQSTTTLPELTGGLQFDLFTDGAGTITGFLEFGEPSSLGRVTLTNPGTAPAWPSFAVAGPAPEGFTLQEVATGRRISVAAVVPAGSVLTVDTDSGSVRLDGADRSGQVTSRQWTAVPPGGSSTWAFSAPTDSDAVLTATIRGTYW